MKLRQRSSLVTISFKEESSSYLHSYILIWVHDAVLHAVSKDSRESLIAIEVLLDQKVS